MADRDMTVFQKALLDAVLTQYQDLPGEKDLEDTYSPKFHAWAEEFRRQQSTKRIQRRRILRNILIAAILTALLAGTAMAIPAVRNAIIDYFFHKHDERIGISFDEEAAATAPKEIKTVYTFSYVPDGFDLMLEDATPTDAILYWTDSSNSSILYSQNVISSKPSDDSWLGIDNENITMEKVLLGDYLVDVVRSEENYKLLWTNNAYLFILQLPNSVSWETATEMFLSWKSAE